MSICLKQNIARQIIQKLGDIKLSPEAFKSHNKKTEPFFVSLPISNGDPVDKIKDVSKDLEGIERVETVSVGKDHFLNFHINTNYLIKSTIDELTSPKILSSSKPKKIVVEFSSPNIAKPFHVGHLRSTIIGNFLANINTYLEENVVKLNYLGDWGTQYGMLKVGVDLCQMTAEDIRNNPIESLYKAYIKANSLAKSDPAIEAKARDAFNQLEKGAAEKEQWNLYRTYTLNELNHTYSRLGIEFDGYHWESMYTSTVVDYIIKDLEHKGVVTTDADGKKVATIGKEIVTLLKSDGSSIYLSRDIAAAHDRFTKYNYDQMLYVVDNGQIKHFKNLFSIFKQMRSPVAKLCQHVRYGRVLGMSTRKGTAVFLKDILDEAMERMHVNRIQSPTTKAPMNDTKIDDILGITGIIVNDLKQKRERDYEFSWEKALRFTGDSGTKLQYTHCRLHSMEVNTGVTIAKECDPRLLQEPEAILLINELARFDDIIRESRDRMEAYVLVIYLFNLCDATNRAIKKIHVKDRPNDLAEQRLLLFHTARLTLKTGMEILGIKPLNEM